MTGGTMRTLLRVLLGGLGVSAVLIALSILTVGAGATAAAAERVFDALSGWRGPDSPRWPPTMDDNELRFYAALWGAYGVVLLLAARDYTGWAVRVPWLAAVFFVGGTGRAFSWLMIGAGPATNDSCVTPIPGTETFHFAGIGCCVSLQPTGSRPENKNTD
jgi:hypothetical protein